MDCLRALEIVSAALDREPVGSAELTEAKEHCRECSSCASFAHALVAVRTAGVPEPPEELVDRVVGSVRAEHARAQRAQAALESARRPGEAAPVTATSAPGAPAEPVSLRERLLHRRNRRALVAWSSAAAVALVAAGIGAVAGTRSLMSERSTPQTIVMESAAVPDDQRTDASSPSDQYGFGDPGAAQPGASYSSELRVGPSGLIVVDGNVYSLAGADSSVSERTLTKKGSTTTALEAGGLSRTRDVLGTSDPARVFVKSDDGEFLAFDRVTTSYEGRTYVLQSAPISAWGASAALPHGMIEPSSDDGAPTFERVDANPGTAIFVLKGKDATTGIALPPGARGDAATGWSWWVPAVQ